MKSPLFLSLILHLRLKDLQSNTKHVRIPKIYIYLNVYFFFIGFTIKSNYFPQNITILCLQLCLKVYKLKSISYISIPS